jgi:hypothetical protein
VNEADYDSYTYDAATNRTYLRKRDAKQLRFYFDALNRVYRKNVPVSASGAAGYTVFAQFNFDPLGRRADLLSSHGPCDAPA